MTTEATDKLACVKDELAALREHHRECIITKQHMAPIAFQTEPTELTAEQTEQTTETKMINTLTVTSHCLLAARADNDDRVIHPTTPMRA